MLLRQVNREQVEHLVVGHALLLERDHLLAHGDHPEVELHRAQHPLRADLLDVGLGLLLRLRVPVAGELLDERGPPAQVELLHLVRLAEVHVDGAGVHGRVGALGLDGADHLAAPLVDDPEGVDRCRSQRDPSGGEAVAARQVAAGALAQLSHADEPLRVPLPARSEDVAVLAAQRKLVGGGRQVRQVDALRLVIEDRALHRPVEELVGVTAEELVEGIVAGDIHRQAGLAAAGPAPHLPQACDRARERDADGGLELADVDPELERVGGDHRKQVALGQPLLDLAPLRRRVAGAVGGDSLGEVGAAVVLEP